MTILQKHYKMILVVVGFKKEEVTYDIVYRTLEEAGMPKEFIVAETVEAFKVELTEAGIINPKNNELTKNAADILYYEFKILL